MKRILFMSAVCALIVWSMSSCEDVPDMGHVLPDPDIEYTTSSDAVVHVTPMIEHMDVKISQLESIHQEEVDIRSSTQYFYPSPNGGQCGKTSYLFALKDYGNDPQRKLQLTLPKGNTVLLNLQRWNDYQYVSVKIYNCGDVYWSMVDQAQIPLTGEYKLSNTGVDIRTSGVSKLGWPYMSDGSSWQNKAGWWEALGSAYHTGTDAYAQDWNWGSGTQDEGKLLTAPYCGKVVFAGWHSNCYGNVVDLVHYAGTQKIMHRIAHMKEVDVTAGQWVARADLLGSLGNSGSSTCSGGPWTPHTHCVLYKLNAAESIVSGLEYQYSY